MGMWNSLSIKEKYDFIKKSVRNNINSLKDVRDAYNKHSFGGNIVIGENPIEPTSVNPNTELPSYISDNSYLSAENLLNPDNYIVAPNDDFSSSPLSSDSIEDAFIESMKAASEVHQPIYEANAPQYNYNQQYEQIPYVNKSVQVKPEHTTTGKYNRRNYNNDTWSSYMMNVFDNAAKAKGITLSNATLYNLVAQAAFEGNYGNSKVALMNNNFGGVKGKGYSGYRRFNSPEEYASNQLSLLSRRYPGALSAKDSLSFANALKRHGYMEANAGFYGNSLNNMSSVRRAYNKRIKSKT